MTLHRRYAYPLWWDLYVLGREWALPLAIEVRPWLIDGSGRREYVARVTLSLLCVHWSIHYAWGRRRYRPPPERILSLSEVMKHDLAEPFARREVAAHGPEEHYPDDQG